MPLYELRYWRETMYRAIVEANDPEEAAVLLENGEVDEEDVDIGAPEDVRVIPLPEK